jgi:hypothetical protein
MTARESSTSQEVTATAAEACKSALGMMRDVGFEILQPVEVVVDPKLPFMGYTIPQGDNFRIVVSGMAVNSGMLEGLLVHEMSHIYRMQTRHPSHNGRIIGTVLSKLSIQPPSGDFEEQILHNLVNHIQDLYADDIALQVFRTGRVLPMEQLSGFFQGWVKDEPVESGDPRRDHWVNSSIMVNNARAIGQMARHGIEDIEDHASKSNARFLSRVSPSIGKHFDYFQNLMANLSPNITEEEYQALLSEYLNRSLQIAERS